MKSISHIATFALVLLLSLSAAKSALALKVAPVPIEKLISDSALVVIGTVTSVDDHAGMKRGTYGTKVSIDVEEVLAGSYEEPTITFELGIGHLTDDTALSIPGLPDFLPGERYLLFVKEGSWSITPVTNWVQGVLREVTVAGRPYYADSSGRVVASVGEKGFLYGKRITPSKESVTAGVKQRAFSGIEKDEAGNVVGSGQYVDVGQSQAAEPLADRVAGALDALQIREQLLPVLRKSFKADVSRNLQFRYTAKSNEGTAVSP